ncbi:molybdopterin converting factor subunit 1 [Bacillus timonensis]|nr:molybdopterin converting factor subunit 1 [Bacillus timonensis]
MIKVLFFAHLQDAVGKESVEIEVDSLTVAELKQQLASDFKLDGLDKVMFAINEEYALATDVISSGDTVALIPPVSGG